MKILDATAGTRSIWYQKSNPFTLFMDKRYEKVYRRDEININSHTQRIMKIYPDIIGNWERLPFKDNSFDIIIFDPPHLIKKNNGKILQSMVKMYGFFYEDNYKYILETGIKELFRTLKPNGQFILKWCECDKPVEDIIKLFPYLPLFGSRTGQKNNNHWITFIKYSYNKELSNYDMEV